MRALFVDAPPGASWALLGLPESVFWSSKTLFLGLHFLMVFRIHFCLVFGANLASKIHQNRWHIEAKMPSHVNMLFWSMFDRFLLPTSTPRTFKIIVFPKEKQCLFKKSPFEDNIVLGSILEANLAPFSSQNPPKSCKNRIPRGIEKLIDFCFDFWSILAPFWGSTWNHVGHQEAPKRPPRRPKRPPRGPQEPPKRPPRRLRSPKRPQETSKIDFSWIFDRFLVDFWSILGWFFIVFWMYFSSILNCFLINFSTMLGWFFAILTGIYLILDGILGTFGQRFFTSSSTHNQCVISLSRFPLFL